MRHPFWTSRDLLFESFHPQIGKYMIGAGAYLAGYHEVPFLPYDFRKSLEWNKAHGRVLPGEVIGAARLPVAISGVICGLLLYRFGFQIAGPITGILAAGIFITSPAVGSLARMAMLDIPALMFGLLALNLCIIAMTSLRAGESRTGFWLAACGAVCGAAVGTKLNALLVFGVCLVVAGGFTIIDLYRCPGRQTRWMPWRVIVTIIVWCWLVFFWSNPLLYTYPVDGIRTMLEMNTFANTPNDVYYLATPEVRVAAVLRNLGDDGIIGAGGLPGSPVWITVGVVTLGSTLIRQRESAKRLAILVVMLWTSIVFVGVTLWIPQNIDRYNLPLIPIAALLQAYGVVAVLRTSLNIAHRRHPAAAEKIKLYVR